MVSVAVKALQTKALGLALGAAQRTVAPALATAHKSTLMLPPKPMQRPWPTQHVCDVEKKSAPVLKVLPVPAVLILGPWPPSRSQPLPSRYTQLCHYHLHLPKQSPDIPVLKVTHHSVGQVGPPDIGSVTTNYTKALQTACKCIQCNQTVKQRHCTPDCRLR